MYEWRIDKWRCKNLEVCTEKGWGISWGTETVEHLWDKCPQEEKEKEKMRHPLAFHAEGKNNSLKNRRVGDKILKMDDGTQQCTKVLRNVKKDEGHLISQGVGGIEANKTSTNPTFRHLLCPLLRLLDCNYWYHSAGNMRVARCRQILIFFLFYIFICHLMF